MSCSTNYPVALPLPNPTRCVRNSSSNISSDASEQSSSAKSLSNDSSPMETMQYNNDFCQRNEVPDKVRAHPTRCVRNEDREDPKLNLMYRMELKQYIQKMQRFIMTSRFNAATWRENCSYRSQYPKFGCIYCSPCPVSDRVPLDSIMFVLEMNNDENRIMGIGTVKNHPRVNGLFVYENANYNRYQFYGKHRIDRSDMVGDEEAVTCAFDILCFTGNSHQKRGQGLKVFPLEMLFRCMQVIDLVDFILNMFKRRMTDEKDGRIIYNVPR